MSKFWHLFMTDVKNLVRVRWLWLYLGAMWLGSFLFLYISQDTVKVVLSLLNITLLIVPLVSAFFSVTYFYDSGNFVRFLLSQPVGRAHVFLSKHLSLSVFLSLIYAFGVLLPLIKSSLGSGSLSLLLLLVVSGVLLNVIFVSLALLVGVLFSDKVKGVSLLLGIWLYLTVLHDGLILAVVYAFRDYPLEKVVLALTVANPVDLSRLLVVINTDVAALMGLSEA
ncbi:hypothetical protein, partial [Hydrogenivirga sp.]